MIPLQPNNQKHDSNTGYFIVGSPHHANIKDLQLGTINGPNTFHMDDQKPASILETEGMAFLETEAWQPAIQIVEADNSNDNQSLDLNGNGNGNGGIDFDKTQFFDNENNLLYTASDGPGIN